METILEKLGLEKNYSVRQIGEYISVSPQCVYDYEKGKKLPGADRLLALMVLYDVDAKELLDIAA